eukprot:CAMPEP_0194767780 /NCGR_PEP_ID=MMETSP0323_2-20130528/37120_1 /TAXON_ID=2866 ORGANISM="Crypthecodinium cohnii, Strain Seligo" /NCGR_SAMPLE_ID=MMETSP0323_2 /ASSEMBLY_ACC=CAM_ASM_000346 /LENGTH=69 /DNA_ID=CAMNT_0039699735 /DNA_START=57 /DNA_END=263 /DNA_ORIENTATION=+
MILRRVGTKQFSSPSGARAKARGRWLASPDLALLRIPLAFQAGAAAGTSTRFAELPDWVHLDERASSTL